VIITESLDRLSGSQADIAALFDKLQGRCQEGAVRRVCSAAR
jgi:hypothetical protein